MSIAYFSFVDKGPARSVFVFSWEGLIPFDVGIFEQIAENLSSQI